jgi:thiosulfate/3-mercaptopyruvate sulfurtransferase
MMWLTTADLTEELSQIQLTDARNKERFAGITEPIDPVAGHIPGAVCMAFEENLGQDGKFLGVEKLKVRFNQFAADRPVGSEYLDVVHMCGSGVTACHNILAMEIAGMPKSRLYVGSWSEWIKDPERSVATED